ncbi:hypothetical protein G6F22_017596 [Rhizopus arrhizus]|nr:hypothetical protein G6F22_017596 [Rhizopus arrhizus]
MHPRAPASARMPSPSRPRIRTWTCPTRCSAGASRTLKAAVSASTSRPTPATRWSSMPSACTATATASAISTGATPIPPPAPTPAVRQRPERPAAGGWPAWRDHAQTALGCQRVVWPQRHRLQPEELDQCLARSGQPDRVRSRPPDPDREERQRRLQLRVGRGRAGQADQRRLRWRVPPGDLPGARR